MTPKPQRTEEKICKLKFIKIDIFYASRKRKDKPQTERKSLQYTCDKELLPKKYKTPKTQQKENNSIKKWAEDLKAPHERYTDGKDALGKDAQDCVIRKPEN